MNTVEVRLYATLRRYHPNADNGEAFLATVDDKSKLENLLEELKVSKGEVTVVMVNGRSEEESYLLQDGDRIGIFPLIGGG